MADTKEPIERAKEVLVYGPIGLAMYLRDTAPSFLKVFVARGRAELDQQRRSVGDQLGQARTVGATAADGTAPLLKMVSDTLERVRETAEGAIGTLSGWAGESVSWSPDDPPDDKSETASSPEATAAPDDADPQPVSKEAPTGTDARRSGGAAGAGALAIQGYDELSASQVVDRLEGLSVADLTAIRDYEQSTRARATILGKIEQLERPA